MTAAYFQTEIRELANFPGINTTAVLAALTEAGGNTGKLQTLYNQLLEDTYGDEY